MKILIVSATKKEIVPLLNNLQSMQLDDLQIDTLITGIGTVFTTYLLTRKLVGADFDVVIHVGIAGSFNSDLQIGETVFVQTDQFADLGIEDKNEFYTVFEKKLLDKNEFPFTNGRLENPYDFNIKLKKVTAITVNTTHGNNKSIDLFKTKFDADIETMEGAALFYICLHEGVRFMQIRSISNRVEERNVANWNIPLAIKNLNQKLFELIDVLHQIKKI